jgi:UDPglucose--hexose-1-phosphate uridylyltransferase
VTDHPHRRYNPLTGEWVLVSPHRTLRPWLGAVEKISADTPPRYDPACYMCPGNARADGHRNPSYDSTFVFDNDYPALLPEIPDEEMEADGLLIARSEKGICRVVCFSPRHDFTLSRMEVADIRRVVDAWTEEYDRLAALPLVNYVQIFENHGVMMGASNPHPHGQIWGSSSIPNEPAKEQRNQQQHRAARHSCLLCDYLALERSRGERLVWENEYFSVVVPFWAVWPFETIVIARRHLSAMPDLSLHERDSLAATLKSLTAAYDNVFQVSFPYSMGFHQRPTDKVTHEEWHLHAHFYPPLLRSATVRKFMVGYEMLGTPQRDITAESAADRLRACF